jgi:hypothetical protein
LAASLAIQDGRIRGLGKLEPLLRDKHLTGDPKTISTYEASADIVLHKGMMASDDPLAFDAGALSGFLACQISRARMRWFSASPM